MASTSADAMEVDSNATLERDAEINKIMKVITIIVQMFGNECVAKVDKDSAEKTIDLDFSDELSGVLMTTFTCLRKELNDKPGHDRYKGHVAKLLKVEVKVEDIVNRIKKEGIELNFLVATPIVELMTLFKPSFDEVRTGVTRFKIRKSAPTPGMKRTSDGAVKDNTHNITQYGLVNHHIPLLQGITFAPERRTGVLKSLGPMTQCILMTQENKYHGKLTTAIKNSLQMLPMAAEITTCLKEARSAGAVSGLLKELGDILLLTTARSTQKIYFPLILIVVMWKSKPAGFKWSFSGADILKMYHQMTIEGWKFQIKSGGTAAITAEVVFHSMFGTYLDDLTILESITTKKATWSNRKDCNAVFQGRSSQSKVTFVPIGFRLISKMAQSLLSKSLGNVDPMATGRPSFSGTRTRSLTNEFLSYLSTGRSAFNFSSDPLQLQFALKKIKDGLMEDAKNKKLLAVGTRKWLHRTDAGVWIECDEVPTEGGRYFYGT